MKKRKIKSKIEYANELLMDLLIHEVGVVEAYQLYNAAKKEYIRLKKLMYEE